MFSFSFSTLTSLVLILYKFSKTQNIMFSTDCLETSDPSSNLSDSFYRNETNRQRSRLVSNCFIVMTPALVVPSLGPSVSGMMLLQRKETFFIVFSCLPRCNQSDQLLLVFLVCAESIVPPKFNEFSFSKICVSWKIAS